MYDSHSLQGTSFWTLRLLEDSLGREVPPRKGKCRQTQVIGKAAGRRIEDMHADANAEERGRSWVSFFCRLISSFDGGGDESRAQTRVEVGNDCVGNPVRMH
jgi:hypothetical protein